MNIKFIFAGIKVYLCIIFHVAIDTMWLLIFCHVSMPTEFKIAFEAGEMIKVPRLLLSEGVFSSEDQLKLNILQSIASAMKNNI